MNFDGSGIKICLQGTVKIFENGKEIAFWNEQDNWSSIEFQKILNGTVESYKVHHEKLLEILFKGNLSLHIYDDSDQYEVMQIYAGEEIIIV